MVSINCYLALSAASLLLALSNAAVAQQPIPARLAGHAILPVDARLEVPADAPADLRVSGKYASGIRVLELGSVPGKSDGRPTGYGLPVEGQPLQGHSGIKRLADGTYWVLSDNGFGNKGNSPDAMLYLNHYRIDFDAGSVTRLNTIFLHDPDRNVPFHIVNESSERRYLTGSDFDPESFQFAGGSLWIGDEFGPYLIQADLDGKVIAVFETEVAGQVVRSPDNPRWRSPGTPDGELDFQVSRSKGFEGMALSADGSKLYPLLEGALWDPQRQAYETENGRRYLRVLEFDLQRRAFSGRSWKYVLEEDHHAIGDFNMMGPTSALVIERDNGEGTSDRACAGAAATADCFSNVAEFKRVYRIDFSDANAGRPVEKTAYVDLLNIQDPHGMARKPLNDGRFTFPFLTIENVDVVDDTHIIVGNDNNFPFSSSREPNRADDNEFILLEVGELMTRQ